MNFYLLALFPVLPLNKSECNHLVGVASCLGYAFLSEIVLKLDGEENMIQFCMQTY